MCLSAFNYFKKYIALNMAQTIIETERFYIRPLVAEDAAGMFDLDSNANVHTYLGNNPIRTLAEAENTIKLIQKQYQDLGIGRWAIIEKSSGNFVGWTGFKYTLQRLLTIM